MQEIDDQDFDMDNTDFGNDIPDNVTSSVEDGPTTLDKLLHYEPTIYVVIAAIVIFGIVLFMSGSATATVSDNGKVDQSRNIEVSQDTLTNSKKVGDIATTGDVSF
jgi:hypothetical protein